MYRDPISFKQAEQYIWRGCLFSSVSLPSPAQPLQQHHVVHVSPMLLSLRSPFFSLSRKRGYQSRRPWGLIHRYAGLLLRRYVLHDPLASFSIASLSSLPLNSLARRLPLYSCVYFLSPKYSIDQSICLLLHLHYKLIYNYPSRVIYSDVWELGAPKCASYAAHRGDFGSIVKRAKETTQWRLHEYSEY